MSLILKQTAVAVHVLRSYDTVFLKDVCSVNFRQINFAIVLNSKSLFEKQNIYITIKNQICNLPMFYRFL